MKKAFLLIWVLLLSIPCFSQTWNQRLNGISMWSLAKDLQGNIYAGTSGTVRAIYKSTNGGDNWSEIFSSGVTNILSISVDSAGTIFAAYGSQGVLKSTNGGQNWITIPSSLFGSSTVQSVRCGKNNYVYVGVTTNGVFRSTDNGETFENTLAGATIVTLYVDEYNSNIIYAGASAASGTMGIFRSSNAGLNWSDNVNPGINCWGIVQKGPSVLFSVTTTSGYPVSKSTNGGLNWFAVGSTTGAMRGMAVDLMGNIYASGNGGIFKSSNNGQTFINYNWAYTANQCLVYQNRIFVAASGTTSGGVWFTVDSTITGVNEYPNIVAKSFELLSAFPNPFNPVTVIRYSVPKTNLVNLSIYNIKGQLVKELVNSIKVQGIYELDYNAAELSSGIYYCKIKTGEFQDSKRIVLLK